MTKQSKTIAEKREEQDNLDPKSIIRNIPDLTEKEMIYDVARSVMVSMQVLERMDKQLFEIKSKLDYVLNPNKDEQ